MAILAIMCGVILLTSHAAVFAAKPWDLLITAKFEQGKIGINDKPVLTGNIIDQKGKPVPGAKVQIRFADNSAATITDEKGNFRYEFAEAQREGIFSASITATLDTLKGMGKSSIRIGSGVSTFDEMYYSKISPNQTQNDPYKILKQKHYEKFIEEQNKRQLKQLEIQAKKIAMQLKRNMTEQKLDNAINETKPGAGIYSGSRAIDNVAKKDARVKAIMQNQLEFTRQIYEEAKLEMKKVLDAGGSLEDAKKAYFAKLATTNEQIQKIGSENNTSSYSKTKTNEDKKINSKKVKGLTYNKYFK